MTTREIEIDRFVERIAAVMERKCVAGHTFDAFSSMCERINKLMDAVQPPKPLTPTELNLASMVASGTGAAGIARQTGKDLMTVKNQLKVLYRKLGISSSDHAIRVKLAVYWNCELFQIGLKELGLINQAA